MVLFRAVGVYFQIVSRFLEYDVLGYVDSRIDSVSRIVHLGSIKRLQIEDYIMFFILVSVSGEGC